MRGQPEGRKHVDDGQCSFPRGRRGYPERGEARSEEHTSELQSQSNLVCRLLLEKKKKQTYVQHPPHHSILALPAQPAHSHCCGCLRLTVCVFAVHPLHLSFFPLQIPVSDTCEAP